MRISGFIVCLSVCFTGCGQDSTRGSGAGDDVGRADAGMANGQMNGDCPEEEWWCAEGADVGVTAMLDAGVKPGGKDGGDKQFNGWIGTETQFSFTRYAAKNQTCALSYTMENLTMIDDCETCEFAYSATLSAVEITLDEGGCGDAGNREGEVLFFGHGTMMIDTGLNVLYQKSEMSWQPVENGFSTVKNDEWTFFVGLDDQMPPPGDTMMTKGIYVLGEVDTSTGLGTYGIKSIDNDGQRTCEISYPVLSVTASDTCVPCTFAYDIALGDAEVLLPGGDCDFFNTLSGMSEGYGHSDPTTLYIKKNEQWNAFGSSEVEGELWRFTWNL